METRPRMKILNPNLSFLTSESLKVIDRFLNG